MPRPRLSMRPLRQILRLKYDTGLSHRAGEKVFVDYSGKQPHIVDRHSGEIVAVEAVRRRTGCKLLHVRGPPPGGPVSKPALNRWNLAPYLNKARVMSCRLSQIQRRERCRSGWVAWLSRSFTARPTRRVANTSMPRLCHKRIR